MNFYIVKDPKPIDFQLQAWLCQYTGPGLDCGEESLVPIFICSGLDNLDFAFVSFCSGSSHRAKREHWLMKPWGTLGLCSQQPHGLHKTWFNPVQLTWVFFVFKAPGHPDHGHQPSLHSAPTPNIKSPAAQYLICISTAEWICWLPFSFPLQVLCAGAGEYLAPFHSCVVCYCPLVVKMLH